MRKSIIWVISLGIIMSFSGCGGESGSISEEETLVATSIVSCESGWTEISSGEDITSEESTQLKFSHTSTGDRKVCVVSGSATKL